MMIVVVRFSIFCLCFALPVRTFQECPVSLSVPTRLNAPKSMSHRLALNQELQVSISQELPALKTDSPVTNSTDDNWGTGTLTGTIGLIAGTAVGGGFLGLPFYTAKLGFMKSSALLIGTWIYLNVQARVFADVCLKSMRRNKAQNVSIYSIALETLGVRSAQFFSLCFFFLMNATLVAQIAKAGDVLHTAFPISSMIGSVLTSTLVAAFVFLSNGQIIEKVNSLLTFALVSAFVLLMGKSVPLILPQNLILTPSSTSGLVPCFLAFPVLLQLLKFHEVIPIVCNRLAGDTKKVRKSFVLGSLVPLTMMLGWNMVACGLVTPGSSAVDPLKILLQSSSVGSIVSVLAFTAILTTTIAGYLSLEQFFRDMFLGPKVETLSVNEEAATPDESGGSSTESSSPQFARAFQKFRAYLFDENQAKLSICACTVLPSLLIAMIGPGAFYAAVEFAGAYPGTILFCLAPPAIRIMNISQIKKRQLGIKRLLLLIAICVGPLAVTAHAHVTAVTQSALQLIFHQ
mmetsp:Transcript_18351/g.24219  ORF Transcript_18351/g.24219 Transcript_18351/m.24219 type:complete len:516 (-) Transcript_18351:284-1831(-)